MKLRLSWEEFILAALRDIKRNQSKICHESTIGVDFLRDYGPHSGGVGEAYDLPHFVDINLDNPFVAMQDQQLAMQQEPRDGIAAQGHSAAICNDRKCPQHKARWDAMPPKET